MHTHYVYVGNVYLEEEDRLENKMTSIIRRPRTNRPWKFTHSSLLYNTDKNDG